MNRKTLYPFAAAIVLLGMLFVSYGGSGRVNAQEATPEPGTAVELLPTEEVISGTLDYNQTVPQAIDETNTLLPGGWIYETVDSLGNVGEYTSLELDTAGYPHISYYDRSNDDLKFAYQDANGWHIATVDTDGGTHSSLELDGSGKAHISYVAGNNIKYAVEGSRRFQIKVVDSGEINHTSLALDANGLPHIAYITGVDQSTANLKYVTQGGKRAWNTHIVDANILTRCTFFYANPEAARWPSIQVDNNGIPTITYSRCEEYQYQTYRIVNNRLKIARLIGGNWTKSTLDNGSQPLPPYADVGFFPSHVYDASNRLHVSHQRCCDVSLYYYPKSDAIPEEYSAGFHSSIAVDAAGYPFISHYMSRDLDLRLTYRDAAGWHALAVDTGGDVGKYSSLALDGAGMLVISYYDITNGDLKIARYQPLR